MEKKTVITNLVLVIVVGVALITAKPTHAFWPFDMFKNKTKERVEPPVPAPKGPLARFRDMSREERQEMRQEHQEFREEYRGELAEFLGLSLDELKEKKQSGQTIAEIAEEQGVDMEEFKAQRVKLRRQHLEEMGLTDDEIAKLEEQIEKRHKRCKNGGPCFPKARRFARRWMKMYHR